MLFNINDNKWDKEILKILKIPKYILPEVKNTADDYGYTRKILPTLMNWGVGVSNIQAAAIGQVLS